MMNPAAPSLTMELQLWGLGPKAVSISGSSETRGGPPGVTTATSKSQTPGSRVQAYVASTVSHHTL